ncbi:MAG: class I SAM-dependent methyltransferase [Planctomycetales bacterium]|nr:class I SAM-dependent methyltransferase [Planctomycetales bacterium]
MNLLLFPLLRLFNAWFVFPSRNPALIRCLRPFIVGSKSILDVGCSDGIVGHELAKEAGATIQGCDVVLQPRCAIPVVRYDGRHLPFADNQFDTVMIADVLHHDLEPIRVIAEALRVSSGRVIIKDHYWENWRQKYTLYFFDWISNAPYGISVPYNFQQPRQWDEMFRALEVTVEVNQRFKLFFHDPCTQVIFVISKANHA